MARCHEQAHCTETSLTPHAMPAAGRVLQGGTSSQARAGPAPRLRGSPSSSVAGVQWVCPEEGTGTEAPLAAGIGLEGTGIQVSLSGKGLSAGSQKQQGS